KETSPPWLRISATVSLPRASRRPLMTTLTPLRARTAAVALPMPLAPPVITATFGFVTLVLPCSSLVSPLSSFPLHASVVRPTPAFSCERPVLAEGQHADCPSSVSRGAGARAIDSFIRLFGGTAQLLRDRPVADDVLALVEKHPYL